MQSFQALSYRDKFRVSRSLVRGEAPTDPEMVPAAIELAEKYQRQSQEYLGFLRWGPPALILGFVALSILAAFNGHQLNSIFWALIAFGQMMLNPLTRPKSMARALETSRQAAESPANNR